jgi:putative transposase
VTKWEIVKYAKVLVKDKRIGVNKVCRLFKISKKTYYQCQNPLDSFQAKYSEIKEWVEKIIEKDPQYGVLRIKAALKEKYSITIGRDVLAKLLRIWGLNLKRTIKQSKLSLVQKILIKLSDKANLLIRETITEPFKAISSDITELSFKGGKAHLCVHKDIFGQLIYGWELSLKQDLSLVMSSFNKARIKLIKLKLKPKLRRKIIWHQDQGSQYTSYHYVQAVLKIGKISFSKKGTPTDNPGQESFFGRFKDENELELRESQTFEELKKKIRKKISYYNNERIHTKTGYQSPKSFTKSFLENGSKWFT